MNFSKKYNKTINYFRSKPSINKLISPFFLMLLLMSSCEAPEDFEYDVTFLSPDESAIYYTDTLNETGESLGADVVEIRAEITGNTEMRSIGIQIRNSSLQIVYDENFDDVEGLLDYTIDTIFQTDVPGFYRIRVITTYGYGQSSFVRAYHERVFEYKDLDDNGEGEGEGEGENNDN
ncbi:hypothetical protein [Psychroserpens sp.]